MKACSFTGHRHIDDQVRADLTDLLDRAVAYVYDGGCRTFYTGGAMGFDTLAAQRVILFRMSHPDVRLHILIPCKNQTVRWRPSDVRLYEYILGMADHVEYLADEYYDGCMAVRNRVLVDRCDFLVAYLTKRGTGTSQTFDRAKSAGRTVFNLASGLKRSAR